MKIAEYDRILATIAKQASIGTVHDFKNGRQLAAWLSLTLSQYSSEGKSRLGKITKAGDAYLSTLLVQGARSVMIGLKKK